ncbi:MAG: TonB-dependent receptor plug domain-containing protein, partial [Bacteroidota bacterium]|nr:TonB-dependent receptor plug domain-containing protein [Bacteroidota bacterium]
NSGISSEPVSFEKVYLHFDREFYASGDDIWFKAYMVNALDNKLANSSKCLYIELISPESKILKREAIQLENGTGNGDFHLKDSLPTGNYMIRAYTTWMQNFGEYFFFKKEIHIEGLPGLAEPPQNSKTPADSNQQIDVQFFPEGGSLIEKVHSTVGFKAVDPTGKGCNITGTVFSDSGDTIETFVSTHLGMGSFNFAPKPGVKYYASGSNDKGIKFKVALPAVLKNGYVFKITDNDSVSKRLCIKTNLETFQRDSLKEMKLIGSVRGSVFITAKVNNLKMINLLRIPTEIIPEGILRLTLFDDKDIPQCERLIFVHHKDRPAIRITTEKKSYVPREKTELKISVKDSTDHPIQANLSLTVVDRKQAGTPDQHLSDIYSYFLLESEIKGHIEQPATYFDPKNENRFQDLDLLLLTQGWRDFAWKHLADTTLTINHYKENGISVSGRLRRLLTNKPIVNANISLVMFDNAKISTMQLTSTDSLGRYYFNPLSFSGEERLIVSATNQKNRSIGWISLDSIFGNPAPIPPLNLSGPIVDSPEISNLKEEAMQRFNINQYSLKDNIQLAEVVVTAKKNEKDKDDGHSRIYGSPDSSIQVTDKDASYSDIFRLIEGRVAGLFISGVYPNIKISIRGAQGNPLFLLDGVPTDIDAIASLPVTTIDKVEVLKSPGNLALFGMQGGSGVISVFTKNGYTTGPALPVYHSINTKVNGFYQARTFYSPKYDDPTQKANKPDLRATIFWQPNVITDKDGNAVVSFFNADKATDVDIRVEGVAVTGDPIKADSNYQVTSGN